jgi:hypothetical protein
MNLSCRQRRLLSETGDALSRSHSRLASMPAIFVQLRAAEEMPGCEQLRTPPLRRIRAALVAAAGAAAALIARRPHVRPPDRLGRGGLYRGRLDGRHRPAGRQASPRSPTAGTRAGERPGQPGLPRP